MSSRKEQILNMLQEEPNDIFLNYALGLEYAAVSDHTKALNQFNAVFTLDPDHVAARHQAALVELDRSNIEDAISHAEVGMAKARAKGDHKASAELQELIDSVIE